MNVEQEEEEKEYETSSSIRDWGAFSLLIILNVNEHKAIILDTVGNWSWNTVRIDVWLSFMRPRTV